VDFEELHKVTPPPHIYVGPCHHGMMCPWVVDGGDSLQIWRVAANTFNNVMDSQQGVDLQVGGLAGGE